MKVILGILMSTLGWTPIHFYIHKMNMQWMCNPRDWADGAILCSVLLNVALGLFLQGKILYKVRWKGYTSDDDTWEPEVHLEDCKEVLLEFRKKIVDNKPKPVKKDIQVCFTLQYLTLKAYSLSRLCLWWKGKGKTFGMWN